MGFRTRKARITTLALAAAAAAFMAASAIAGVTVYTNNFSSKRESKELRHAEGKKCEKNWRKKAKSVVIKAKKGPTVCGYRPPVEGDGKAPDHSFQAQEKLLKDTPKSVRDRVYLGVAVRSGKKVGYELWVFPTKGKFKVARRAGGGGVNFLAKGNHKAIKGGGKPNVLSLKAVGSKVIAKVNGKRVAKTVDRKAGAVDGRKMEAMLGYKKRRSKPALATFDNLKVQVPKP
jgi:hypothetical protein